MTLVGLWHGATAPFLLWGAYHGLLLDLHAWFDRRRLLRLPGSVAHALLLIAVLFGWALFLSPDLRFAGSLVSHLTGGHGIGALPRLAACYGAVTPVVLVALALTAADLVEADKVPRPRSWTFAAATGLLASLCLLRANAAVVQFAYAQF
jgi:alginate O-acetyltransferase complex protein AlgI